MGEQIGSIRGKPIEKFESNQISMFDNALEYIKDTAMYSTFNKRAFISAIIIGLGLIKVTVFNDMNGSTFIAPTPQKKL